MTIFTAPFSQQRFSFPTTNYPQFFPQNFSTFSVTYLTQYSEYATFFVWYKKMNLSWQYCFTDRFESRRKNDKLLKKVAYITGDSSIMATNLPSWFYRVPMETVNRFTPSVHRMLKHTLKILEIFTTRFLTCLCPIFSHQAL